MKRGGLKRTKGPRRTRRPRGGEWVEGFYLAVCTVETKAGRKPAPCVMCGTTAGILDPHHLIAQESLRAYAQRLGWDEATLAKRLGDPRNGVCTCRRCHDRHEVAFRRLPRRIVPAVAWEFAAELDALLGTESATRRLEAAYP